MVIIISLKDPLGSGQLSDTSRILPTENVLSGNFILGLVGGLDPLD